ncbi:MAG: hypothetical protein CSA74_00210 [Rhodobacterales bacterium]|nr:MAG: hypothetical protein CSA74_00210 [Rhodobacterales bacterium]
MMKPEEILTFWLDDVGPERWYAGGRALDGEIRERFLDVWEQAQHGACSHWLTGPDGVLAYLILLDQFPRHMFRGGSRAYATDPAALAAAKCAIDKRWDEKIPEPARQFFYLPLMHSESQTDQDRCVRLLLTRMPENGRDNLIHARAHRELIRRYGRFPYRNAALGRPDTADENAFNAAGGYRSVLQAMQG